MVLGDLAHDHVVVDHSQEVEAAPILLLLMEDEVALGLPQKQDYVVKDLAQVRIFFNCLFHVE